MSERVSAIMDRTRGLRTQLLATVSQASEAEMCQRPDGRWSGREILIHLGSWEEQGNIWFDCLLNNRSFPDDDASDIDAWNARHLAKYDHLDVAGALAYLAQVRAGLEERVAQLSDDQFENDPSYLGLLLMTPDHEAGHIHQLREALALARGDQKAAGLHYLAYARQRVLTRLNLEFRPVAALAWKPAEGGWSVKEMLIHLSVWDRSAAGFFGAIADGRPLPPPPVAPGESADPFNQRTVAERSWWTLAEVLHEFGAARGALEEQFRRLAPEQVGEVRVKFVLKGHRDHDDHHMHKILERLQQWKADQSQQ